MSERFRARCAFALGVYLLFLAFVLWQGDAALATRVIHWCSRVLLATPLPDGVAMPIRVEFVLNVLMIVPAAMLVSLVFPRHPWANWVVYGFVAGSTVEMLQGALRPLRSAQYVDVVANTLGVLIGVLLAAVLQWRAGRIKHV